jgi:uncharacterized protein (UPF0264 family)
MTGMLASVRSLAEARIVLAAGVDLIDLKEPAAGALGALEEKRVRRIVRFVDGRKPVSATVGDLPCEAALVDDAIGRRAACGVDLLKIGISAAAVDRSTLRVLERRAAAGNRIVLVFFAEFWRGNADLRTLRSAGITGVMLDTAEKTGGPLTRRLGRAELAGFVEAARETGLLCGLAGSLSEHDARLLLPLRPDYLGFRGALCVGGRRSDTVDACAVHGRTRNSRRPHGGLKSKEATPWPNGARRRRTKPTRRRRSKRDSRKSCRTGTTRTAGSAASTRPAAGRAP